MRELQIGLERYVGEEKFSPVMHQPPPGDTYRFAVPVLQTDMAWLGGLQELTDLSVYSLSVNDAEFLASLVNLEGLELRNAGVSRAALGEIARLPNLTILNISNNWLDALRLLRSGNLQLWSLQAYWNCLDLFEDDTLQLIEEVLAPDGWYVVEPQRPLEECQ
jgi:hypothetical protein